MSDATTGARQQAPDSPIEAYLDTLLTASLPGPVRATRHLLAETEAHLRDAAAAAVARGLSAYEAEADAVARFGPAADIASEERHAQTTPLGVLLRQCVSSTLLLAAVGGIAVGASGIGALVMRWTGGARFLIDQPRGAALSATNCARWMAASEHGATCAQAGLADWADETVMFRLVAGAFGVLALLMLLAVRRRWRGTSGSAGLPVMVVETAAVLAFGASGIWLAGLGVDSIAVSSGHGAGQWLSAAPVSLALAVYFGFRLQRDLRQPRDPQLTPAVVRAA